MRARNGRTQFVAALGLLVLAACLSSCSTNEQAPPDIVGGPPIGGGEAPPLLRSVTPSTSCGTAGSVLTLVGNDLAPNGAFPGVLVNNVPATVTSVLRGSTSLGTSDVVSVTTSAQPGTIPPGGLQVDVKVTTVYGSDTLENAILLLPRCDAPPIVVEVDPSTAGRVGGTPIELRGDGLACVTQVLLVGRVSGLVFDLDIIGVESDRSITVASPATASTVSEQYDVRVTSSCGTAIVASAFTFTGGAGTGDPDVANGTGITPDRGPAAGGTAVTITGSNLGEATSIRIGATTLVKNVGFFVDAEGRIFIPAMPPSPAGSGTSFAASVVILAGSTEDPSPLRYDYLGSGSPACASFTPVSGSTAGGTDIVITGTGIDSVSEVQFGGVPATNLTHPTTGVLAVTTPAYPFAIDVDVELMLGGVAIATCPSVFTYEADSTTPPFDVVSVSPNSGLQTGNEVITLTGTGLDIVTQVRICNLIVNPPFLEQTPTFIRLLTPPFTGAVPVTCDVAASTSTGATDTLIRGFTYVPPTPDGQTFINGVTAAPASGGGNFRIQGTNLVGVNGVHFGGTEANDALACDIHVQSNTEITGIVPAYFTPGGPFPANVAVFPESQSGIDPTTVRTSSGALFRYYADPTLSSATGPSGDVVQIGTVVTVTGSNFMPPDGFSTDVFVGSVTLRNAGYVEGTTPGEETVSVLFNVVDASTLTFFFPAVAVADYYDITITTPDQNASCVNDYSFTLLRSIFFGRDPNAAVIEPNRGPWTGGTTARITGDFTLPIASVAIGSDIQTILDQNATSVTIRVRGLLSEPTDCTAQNVVLTDQLGQTETITAGYTFIPDPRITTVSVDTLNCGTLDTAADGTLPVQQGQVITITGTRLCGIRSVKVGTAVASVVSVTNTDVTASLPAAPAGGPKFDVTTETTFDRSPAGTTDAPFVDVVGGALQYQTAPTVTGINPTTGAVGSVVVITGTNLVNVNGLPTTVTFDGVDAGAPLSASATSLTVQVPAGTPGDSAVVAVSTCAGDAAAAQTFTYPCTPPNVTSMMPSAGSQGTDVTLTGTALLGPSGEDPVVTFGTGPTAATASIVSTSTAAGIDTVVVDAPAGAAGSRVDVNLTTCGGTDKAPTQFTFGCGAPRIDSVTPAYGKATDTVTIAGDNLNSPDGSGVLVTFGAANGTVLTETATALTVRVPAGTGTVDVGVANCSGAPATLAGAFTYCVLPTFTVKSVSQGAAGTVVTISGTPGAGGSGYRNPDGSLATVSFGGTNAVVSGGAADGSSIIAVAPAGLAGSQTVIVNTCAGPVNAGQFLFCSAPVITAFAPKVGAPGTNVTIDGSFLVGADGSDPVIRFGAVAVPTADILVKTATQLVVRVPVGATAPAISVQTCGGTATTVTFTPCDAPVIESLNPINGPTGSNVTIFGSNLVSDNGATPEVFFGTVKATQVLSVADDQIVAVAPGGIGAGTTVKVTVVHCGGTSTLSVVPPGTNDFTFQGASACVAPTVSSITPSKGATTGGTLVTITGTNLIGSDGNVADVYFGGSAGPPPTGALATIVTATPTTLVVSAPAGVGTLAVRVETCGGNATAATPFTYCSVPTVTSITPTTGFSTTPVRINGTNLRNADFSAVTVRFGSVTATVLDPGDGSYVIAAAPTGFLAGTTVQVSVETCGGRTAFAAAANFTYVTVVTCNPPTPPSITGVTNNRDGSTIAVENPLHVLAGDVIVIAGTNLIGADGSLPNVKFGEGSSDEASVAILDAVADRLTVLVPATTDASVPYPLGTVVRLSVTTCGGSDQTVGAANADVIYQP